MALKKIFSLLILSCLILPATAEVLSDYVPQWREFCPAEYLNAEYIETSYNELTNGLMAASLVLIPFAMYNYDKHQKNSLNNYWYSRRIDFEDSLAVCEVMKDKDQKTNCYNILRMNEISMNNQLDNQAMMAAIVSRQNMNNFNTRNSINQIQQQNKINNSSIQYSKYYYQH